MSTYVTPKVRALADQLSVDLATIAGTGPGGRISQADVRAAAVGRGPADASLVPASAARFTRPKLMQEARTEFGYGVVQIDAFSLNPLLDDLKQSDPENLAAAIKFDVAVPTMFSGGDVPLFTATGFDPELIVRLPWAVRHVAAGLESEAKVAEIFELCGAGTLDSVHHAQHLGVDSVGFQAYRRRMREWLNARHVIKVPKALTLADFRGLDPNKPDIDGWAHEMALRTGTTKRTASGGSGSSSSS